MNKEKTEASIIIACFDPKEMSIEMKIFAFFT